MSEMRFDSFGTRPDGVHGEWVTNPVSPSDWAALIRRLARRDAHSARPSPQRRYKAGTQTLRLIERVDYGAEVQSPTCVLRFAIPGRCVFARLAGRGWPRFAAGDLIAVLPPDDTLPRHYLLASSSGDGFTEICVRKHPGGLCSGFLHGLQPGDSIEAFVKANPAFRPDRGRKPVILIGAGTGIGPLAGFIRAMPHAGPCTAISADGIRPRIFSMGATSPAGLATNGCQASLPFFHA